MEQNGRSEERLGDVLANRNNCCQSVAGAVAILSLLAVAAYAIFLSPTGHLQSAPVSVVLDSSSAVQTGYSVAI